MVYEQGHIVDSIEASVEQTSVFVSEGTESLRKASHFQVSKHLCSSKRVVRPSNPFFVSISRTKPERRN
jgi:hypothetical protein